MAQPTTNGWIKMDEQKKWNNDKAGYNGLVFLRILIGLGQGIIYSALTDLLAAWVPLQERTTLGSIAYSGSTVCFCFHSQTNMKEKIMCA